MGNYKAYKVIKSKLQGAGDDMGVRGHDLRCVEHHVRHCCCCCVWMERKFSDFPQKMFMGEEGKLNCLYVSLSKSS